MCCSEEMKYLVVVLVAVFSIGLVKSDEPQLLSVGDVFFEPLFAISEQLSSDPPSTSISDFIINQSVYKYFQFVTPETKVIVPLLKQKFPSERNISVGDLFGEIFYFISPNLAYLSSIIPSDILNFKFNGADLVEYLELYIGDAENVPLSTIIEGIGGYLNQNIDTEDI